MRLGSWTRGTIGVVAFVRRKRFCRTRMLDPISWEEGSVYNTISDVYTLDFRLYSWGGI